MAAIKYTSIINSFVSQEGDFGMYTNYIYYSLLVVYTDGTAEIVEGKNNDIRYLLSYLRTPIDELKEIKQTISHLPSQLNTISEKIDEKLSYVIDSLYPIPDVRGMKEAEALKCIEEYNLVPNTIQNDGISHGEGTVYSLKRNAFNFKRVDVGITHGIPAVDGLTKDVAIEILEKVGFQVKAKYVPSQEQEKDIVLRYHRIDDTNPMVELEVGSSKPVDEKLIQFFESINSATRFQIIASQWNTSGLNENPLYADMDKKIKSKAETERMYGPNRNPQVIQNFIEELRTQYLQSKDIEQG